MKLVLGEVSEKNGKYSMKRAIRLDVEDSDLDNLTPEEFCDKYLYPAAQQLMETYIQTN